ncbi:MULTISPECIES: hypothetical protein [unclassified Spirillospora]|uniref:hypothetical protein n=1 Tax=unclassified Spirillospora TaxID=2642701 RepID=UPI00371AA540
MTNSIEDALHRALLVAGTWSALTAQSMASDLARDMSAEVDWDENAGETWLRVIAGKQVVGLISTVLPFAFIQENTMAKEEGMVIVTVDDFNYPQLSCSLSTLNNAFDVPERLQLLDLEKFSVNDLWYATV